MLRPIGTLLACCTSFLLLGGALPEGERISLAAAFAAMPVEAPASPAPEPASPAPPVPEKPAPPPLPTPEQALQDGVLILVSIPTQRMFVLRDGELWDSAPVSTGKPGDETPTGVFPILQKRIDHRSNLYDNAPMPYMQRLTWDGVALHGGNLPGYPASHGCIRLPQEFARQLYKITDFTSTVVLVTDEPLGTAEEARLLGSGDEEGLRLAARQRDPVPVSVDGEAGTIQLSASTSQQQAAAYWQELAGRAPELGRLKHEIVPASVGGRQVFRLRASGPGAGSICRGLAGRGIACVTVGRSGNLSEV